MRRQLSFINQSNRKILKFIKVLSLSITKSLVFEPFMFSKTSIIMILISFIFFTSSALFMETSAILSILTQLIFFFFTIRYFFYSTKAYLKNWMILRYFKVKKTDYTYI